MSVSATERSRLAEAANAVPAEPARNRTRLGLAGRLLLLTIGSIVASLLIFYVVRLASWRESWLSHRIVSIETLATAFADTTAAPLSRDLAGEILESEQVTQFAVEIHGRRVAHVFRDVPAPDGPAYDIDNATFVDSLVAAFQSLAAPPGSILKFAGAEPTSGARVEFTIETTTLTKSLWRNSRNFLVLSLIVTVAGSLALWAALWRMVIRPVRRLTSSIIAFGADPQDIRRIIQVSGRGDDIGHAEAALASMQSSLAHELSQRKRLAELGMAVARINHDLRNMLAAAQLISDRLADIADPSAQRLAPRLVAALDRAIGFCQSTLTYGGAREQTSVPRRFDLREVVREIIESHEISGASRVSFSIDIPPNFELFADADQVRRVFENLARNAVEALEEQPERSARPTAIRFAAIRTSTSEALIEVSDSGPGIPAENSEVIFEPFHNSTRNGGSGLGLAIANDLVHRNGGTIRLAPGEPEHFYCGARFLITLPTPETDSRSPAASQT